MPEPASGLVEVALRPAEIALDVLAALLAGLDLGLEALTGERRGGGIGRELDGDLGRDGPVGDGAGGVVRLVVVGLHAEAGHGGVAELLVDERLEPAADPGDAVGLVGVEGRHLFPGADAHAHLEHRARQAEVLDDLPAERQLAGARKRHGQDLGRGQADSRRLVADRPDRVPLGHVLESVLVTDADAPGAGHAGGQFERPNEIAVGVLGRFEPEVPRKLQRAGEARLVRPDADRDSRRGQADDRAVLHVGVRRTPGVGGMGDDDLLVGEVGRIDNLHAEDVAQRTAALDAVGEVALDARVDVAVGVGAVTARDERHALADLAAAGVGVDVGLRAAAGRVAQRDLEGRAADDRPVAVRHDVHRSGIDVADRRRRIERLDEQAHGVAAEDEEEEPEDQDDGQRRQQAGFHGALRELAFGRDLAGVQHGRSGDFGQQARGGLEVAGRGQFDDGRQTLLELRMVALDEGCDLGRSELAPHRTHEREPERDADGHQGNAPERPAGGRRKLVAEHGENGHVQQDGGEGGEQHDAQSAREEDAPHAAEALVELDGDFWRDVVEAAHGNQDSLTRLRRIHSAVRRATTRRKSGGVLQRRNSVRSRTDFVPSAESTGWSASKYRT